MNKSPGKCKSSSPTDTHDNVCDDRNNANKASPAELQLISSDCQKKRRSSEQNQARKSAKRRNKNDGKPKRPLSAYNLYFKEERLKWLVEQDERKKTNGPAIDENRFLSMTKEIGKRWMKMGDNEREKYERQARAEMKEYQRKKAAYNERLVRDSALGRATLDVEPSGDCSAAAAAPGPKLPPNETPNIDNSSYHADNSGYNAFIARTGGDSYLLSSHDTNNSIAPFQHMQNPSTAHGNLELLSNLNPLGCLQRLYQEQTDHRYTSLLQAPHFSFAHHPHSGSNEVLEDRLLRERLAEYIRSGTSGDAGNYANSLSSAIASQQDSKQSAQLDMQATKFPPRTSTNATDAMRWSSETNKDSERLQELLNTTLGQSYQDSIIRRMLALQQIQGSISSEPQGIQAIPSWAQDQKQSSYHPTPLNTSQRISNFVLPEGASSGILQSSMYNTLLQLQQLEEAAAYQRQYQGMGQSNTTANNTAVDPHQQMRRRQADESSKDN